jgi:arginine decarboxylase
VRDKYADLIDQTFDFPQNGFEVKNEELYFHGVALMDIIEQYGTPLKLTYLPRISTQIKKARKWFDAAMRKHQYAGRYYYSYCTKSNHFSFVLKEVLKNKTQLEISSAFDISIIQKLHKQQKLDKDIFIICNGYKPENYLDGIRQLINDGFHNTITIFDNVHELDYLSNHFSETQPLKVGIRIATEEEPRFLFYTSRLGIRYKKIISFYKEKIATQSNIKLTMLHFFINTGIKDTAYYWNELSKAINLYVELRKLSPDLKYLNIGGGLPIKTSLSFEYDYEYMIDEIVGQIKSICDKNNVPTPDIITEFGNFTVGESAANIYSIINQKKQNDREAWDMINSSILTTLPDIWALNQRYVLLPINHWDFPYERVHLGGLTCDSEDFYSEEAHSKAIFLPRFEKENPLHIGFFHTGAYQEALAGYGGIQHCLIPAPKHVLVDIDEDGQLTTSLFSEEQNADSMLNILGF